MTTQTDTKNTGGEGNTKPPPHSSIRGRRWTATLNNWVQSDIDTIKQRFLSGKYVIGKEGKEDGKTPHLQCYLESKNPVAFTTLQRLSPRAHWEKAKGTLAQNYTYCTKEGDFETNIDNRTHREKLIQLVLDNEYKDVVWKPWQTQVIRTLASPPVPRKIDWYWENTGNVGKTYLAKYIGCTQSIILCEGKKADIFNQVNMAIEAKKTPKIILVDIPRSSFNYVNYAVLEKLKDGFIYSGKYEGGQCIIPTPHIVCFANEKPAFSSLSADRWNVIEIQADA